LLVASVTVDLGEYEEEQSLIKEVADDIAFALSSIEKEEQNKQAEIELELRAQLLDAATDAIITLDTQGNVVYFNEAAHRSRGYTRE
jgi:PAS domain-containing protein